MTFLLTILFLGLFFWLLSLQNQVDKLEQKLMSKAAPTKVVKAAAPKPKTVTKKVLPSVKKPIKKLNLEEWLTKKLFPVLGSVSLILAVTYFATMAITNGWIGPMAQLSFAALACAVLLGIGEWLRPKYPQFFAYVSAAGIAGLMMTTFVAQTVYGVIGPVQSFLFYSAIVAGGVFLSLRYDRRELADLALVGGLLAPVLTQAPEPSALGLMLFLLSLAVAGFAISIHKKWPELLALLLVGTFFYEMALVSSGGTGEAPLLYLGLIYLIHLLLGSGGVIRALREKKQSELSANLGPVTLVVSVLTANWLGYEIFSAQNWDHFGFFVLLQSLGWFGLWHWSRTQKIPTYEPIFLLGGLASVLFATLWELKAADKMILTSVLAVESIALAWVTRLQKNELMSFFAVAAGLLAWIVSWSVDGILWGLYVIILVGGALLFAAQTYPQKPLREVLKIMAFVLISSSMLGWQYGDFADWTKSLDLGVIVPLLPMALWLLGSFYATNLEAKPNHQNGLLVAIMVYALLPLFEYNDWNVSGSFLWLAFATGLLTFVIYNGKELLLRQISLGLVVLHLLVFGMVVAEEPDRTIFWLLSSLILLFVGFKKEDQNWRYAGLGLITWVIAKLYIFDVWQWEIWIRFSAFFALGVALLGVAFYYQRLNNKK